MKKLYLFTLLITVPFFSTAQTVEQLNTPLISQLDDVAPFHEGLAAVRKGNQWAFMDREGNLAIPFRDDVLWNSEATTATDVSSITYPKFSDGMCVIFENTDEDIPLYGFMDTKGKTVIPPEFINISPFEGEHTVGIYARKDLRGKNEFQLNIYDYTFTEVVVNKAGEMVWPVHQRQNIILAKKRYKLPELHVKIISSALLAVKGKDNLWKVVKVELDMD